MDEAKALATALSTIGKFTVKAKVGEDKRIFGRHVSQRPTLPRRRCLDCGRARLARLLSLRHKKKKKAKQPPRPGPRRGRLTGTRPFLPRVRRAAFRSRT
jgi:hypothetical protein